MRAIANGVNYYRRYECDEWGVGTSLETGSPLAGDLDRARWKGALYAAPEAGLYYLRNRWYEPRSGRFVSEDPLGLAGGLNAYAFAGADPVGGSDPEGLCTRTTITAGGQTSAPRVFCDAWAAFPWDTWEGCYRTRGGRGDLECQQERFLMGDGGTHEMDLPLLRRRMPPRIPIAMTETASQLPWQH